jgi:DNA-binding MarR family transcriptional regulator
MSETRWLDDGEQQTWRTFMVAVTVLFEKLRQELLRETGLSLPDYEILVRLSEAEGGLLRMSQLANSAVSSRSKMSHAVARLEAAGWVRREGCPTDKRGAFAILTEEGMEKLVSAAPFHVEGVRTHLFDPLEPAQVGQLATISEALVAHLGVTDACSDLLGATRTGSSPA